MPELPEVQTVVDDLLRAGLLGCSIVAARVNWPRSICGMTGEAFCGTLIGSRIIAITRRGKYIHLTLSGGRHLLIHLRMSGQMLLEDAKRAPGKHEHVLMTLDDGRRLSLHDTRKFGRCHLVADPAAIIGDLGPEPLNKNFSADRLHAILQQRQRALKPLLLDQKIIAGLGNIYVDEALWLARLHPQQPSGRVSQTESRRLHRAIRRVLRCGLANLGTTLGGGKANFYSVGRRRGRNQDQLKVFRRTGEACLRCGALIVRIKVAQRGTHICPRCQRLDKSLSPETD